VTELAVCDTHALVWHALARRQKLGRAGRDLFERADAGKASIAIPVLAVVELLEGTRKGAITFPEGPGEWLRALTSSGGYFVAELTAEIALVAHRLYAIRERGDRLLAATAIHLGCPLITRDPAIAAVGVEVLW
jgi:PIN domain nuclease of toxin-antitoxin system